MTLTEKLFIEGWKRGYREACRRVVSRLLESKFGPNSPEVVARLEAAQEEDLCRYAERVPLAMNLDEVFPESVRATHFPYD
ncbi:MAG: hypothetical protein QM784_20355 [Polyangiaceae bacterium]